MCVETFGGDGYVCYFYYDNCDHADKIIRDKTIKFRVSEMKQHTNNTVIGNVEHCYPRQ